MNEADIFSKQVESLIAKYLEKEHATDIDEFKFNKERDILTLVCKTGGKSYSSEFDLIFLLSLKQHSLIQLEKYIKQAVHIFLNEQAGLKADWMTIAPLLKVNFNGKIKLPYNLSKNISIDYRPKWLSRIGLGKLLSASQYDELKESEIAIIVRYQAHSKSDEDNTWKGTQKRSILNWAEEQIHFAYVSLWLAIPTTVNYQLLVHCERLYDSHWEWRQCSSFMDFIPYYSQDNISSTDLKVASSLLSPIIKIKRLSSLWMAIFWLSQALREENWQLRYFKIWIGLEALFSPGAEVTYRISMRIAAFLSNSQKGGIHFAPPSTIYCGERYELSSHCWARLPPKLGTVS